MNEQIRAPQLRLIGADGKQIGIVSREEALRQARVAGLDLVEVNAAGNPPVGRLLDYGKYQYAVDKREREIRKKQKKIEVKGVRISFKMGPHDLDLRKSLAEKFLKDGQKVRVEMVLRGREKTLRPIGIAQMEAFLRSLASLSTLEEPIASAPRGLAAVIAPRQAS